jgi:hypothetical protein
MRRSGVNFPKRRLRSVFLGETANHETMQSVAVPSCVRVDRNGYSTPGFWRACGGRGGARSNAEPYLNTSDGLRQLLLEPLRLAKAGDPSKLRITITGMEIPDDEHWSPRVFRQEKGQKFGDRYQESLKASELHFEMLWIELAKQQCLISVDRLDPQTAFGIPPGTLEGYRANWKKTDDSAGPDYQFIGVFFFGGKISGGRVAARCRRPPNG